MAATQFKKQALFLFGAAIMGWSMPAHAGFEFTPPPSVAPAEETAQQATDAPMPIVSTEAVTAEPLPAPDHVLSLPVSYRQTEKAYPAPANEPMDTQALLNATENNQMVTLPGSPRPNKAAPSSGQLVINPYPLDSGEAVHGGGMGRLAIEQGMMEQSGKLHPVQVPGNGRPTGMIARAKISSRLDSGEQQYLSREDREDGATFAIASSMTPIPGGEGEPLSGIEAMPLKPRGPSAAPTAMPRPAVPQGYPQPAAAPVFGTNAGYAEAVGFGRDLPLALALSQVVPPEYSYAFGQDINVGTMVSWQGGRPWPDVLNEMLAQNGLRANINGKQVTIVPLRG
ncbi:MAG: hypothetical protein DI551_00285 [Micavibrio aeruginosavorus]|uniref:Uncharacterized protein n=1 Tax=Micavibrio aeruginosavorus TaxID=349221 RepID=A0A2W5Q2Y1_9BACT|nr:MAG: hypothetical protein DI551_00285 [Micavibrio aeruginosavorus]